MVERQASVGPPNAAIMGVYVHMCLEVGMETTIRWSLKVSKQTDEALRTYLGQSGARKGDLSRFVEEAVREQLTRAVRAEATRQRPGCSQQRQDFAETLSIIRTRARSLTRSQVESLATEAVAFARSSR